MIILKTHKFELKKRRYKKNYNTLVTISQLFKKFSLEPHVVDQVIFFPIFDGFSKQNWIESPPKTTSN